MNQNILEQVAYVLQDNYWGSRRLPVKNLYNEGAIDASKDVAVIDPQWVLAPMVWDNQDKIIPNPVMDLLIPETPKSCRIFHVHEFDVYLDLSAPEEKQHWRVPIVQIYLQEFDNVTDMWISVFYMSNTSPSTKKVMEVGMIELHIIYMQNYDNML